MDPLLSGDIGLAEVLIVVLKVVVAFAALMVGVRVLAGVGLAAPFRPVHCMVNWLVDCDPSRVPVWPQLRSTSAPALATGVS